MTTVGRGSYLLTTSDNDIELNCNNNWSFGFGQSAVTGLLCWLHMIFHPEEWEQGYGFVKVVWPCWLHGHVWAVVIVNMSCPFDLLSPRIEEGMKNLGRVFSFYQSDDKMLDVWNYQCHSHHIIWFCWCHHWYAPWLNNVMSAKIIEKFKGLAKAFKPAPCVINLYKVTLY